MRKILITGAAALAFIASPALAQSENNTTYTDTQEREDDDDFPWGLLGLLGLAGLIPRKKAPDVHIDNRTR